MINTKGLADVMIINNSYETTAKNIELILVNEYHMNYKNARAAVSASPLKALFEKHSDMASHTSNEDWAWNVYNYWNKNNFDK